MVDEIQLMEFEDAYALEQKTPAVPQVPGAQGNKKQKNNNNNRGANNDRPKNDRQNNKQPQQQKPEVQTSIQTPDVAPEKPEINIMTVLAQAVDDLPVYLNMVDNYTKCVQSLLPVKPTTAAICVGVVTVLAAFLAVKREE